MERTVGLGVTGAPSLLGTPSSLACPKASPKTIPESLLTPASLRLG